MPIVLILGAVLVKQLVKLIGIFAKTGNDAVLAHAHKTGWQELVVFRIGCTADDKEIRFLWHFVAVINFNS